MGAGRGARIVTPLTVMPPMRPRYEAFVPVAQTELVARVRRRMERAEPRVHAVMADKHLELLVDPSDRHFWSPWLSVDIEAAEGGSAIRARFGPHPAVWTLFMTIYIALSFITLGAGIYALALWTLGHEPWPLWLVPLAFALMGGAYVATLIGQGMGSDQTYILQAALDDMLGHSTADSALLPAVE